MLRPSVCAITLVINAATLSAADASCGQASEVSAAASLVGRAAAHWHWSYGREVPHL